MPQILAAKKQQKIYQLGHWSHLDVLFLIPFSIPYSNLLLVMMLYPSPRKMLLVSFSPACYLPACAFTTFLWSSVLSPSSNSYLGDSLLDVLIQLCSACFLPGCSLPSCSMNLAQRSQLQVLAQVLWALLRPQASQLTTGASLVKICCEGCCCAVDGVLRGGLGQWYDSDKLTWFINVGSGPSTRYYLLLGCLQGSVSLLKQLALLLGSFLQVQGLCSQDMCCCWLIFCQRIRFRGACLIRGLAPGMSSILSGSISVPESVLNTIIL